MHRRCKSKPGYVGVVEVCPEWADFLTFLADMGAPPLGKTLDRIDNAEGYCKRNCRWATAKAQANNRTNSRLVEIAGRTQTLAEWAEELEVNYYTLYGRYRQGRFP